jgi:hypothetical protein
MLIVCVPRNQVYTYTIQKMETEQPMSQYIIYLPNNVLQKTKSNTHESIAVQRHHNSTGNRPVTIARLELHIIVLQIIIF